MSIIRKDKRGFWSDEGHYYMQRCRECDRENYAPVVAMGKCAWCGYTHTDSVFNKGNNDEQ